MPLSYSVLGFSFNYTPIIGEHIAVNKRIAIGGWLKNSLMANFTTNCHHSFSLSTHLPKPGNAGPAGRADAAHPALLYGADGFRGFRHAF
ncbi:MAG: hypothetical protein ACLTOV_10710 [Phocaeicola sp.]